MSGFEFKDIMNVAWNIAAPFSSGDMLAGSTLTVFSDTMVEYLVRKLLKKHEGWTPIAMSHLYSLVFRGAPFVFTKDFKTDETKFFGNVQDGLQVAPGVLIGQYIHATFASGFHLPGFDLWNIVAVLVSQGLSSPLKGFVKNWGPDYITGRGLELSRVLARNQKLMSITKMETKDVR